MAARDRGADRRPRGAVLKQKAAGGERSLKARFLTRHAGEEMQVGGARCPHRACAVLSGARAPVPVLPPAVFGHKRSNSTQDVPAKLRELAGALLRQRLGSAS